MFATGIENSIPKIKGGKIRADQMESRGHHGHGRRLRAFELANESD
jgi:hypothetical protein